MVSPPEYRLRLFLSVDLVGSTAFKARQESSNINWIKVFQRFYQEFPSNFSRRYAERCRKVPDLKENEVSSLPMAWKTIGDEILFVNRILSVAHLGVLVSAFVDTLVEYGKELNPEELDTKGNGWIAAFPTPNRIVKLSSNFQDLASEPDFYSEEHEAAADIAPRDFDFLGKGIDSGFRIARNSSVDAFTISPALAYLLCRAKKNEEVTKFDCRFEFHEPQSFKGVVGGVGYPVISVITSRNEDLDLIRKLEAKLLNGNREVSYIDLMAYLEKYMSHHRIEFPELKLFHSSSPVSPPKHYSDYILEWERDLRELQKKAEVEEASAGDEVTVSTAESFESEIPGTQIDQVADAAAMRRKLVEVGFLKNTESHDLE